LVIYSTVQMGINSVFKGLTCNFRVPCQDLKFVVWRVLSERKIIGPSFLF